MRINLFRKIQNSRINVFPKVFKKTFFRQIRRKFSEMGCFLTKRVISYVKALLHRGFLMISPTVRFQLELL